MFELLSASVRRSGGGYTDIEPTFYESFDIFRNIGETWEDTVNSSVQYTLVGSSASVGVDDGVFNKSLKVSSTGRLDIKYLSPVILNGDFTLEFFAKGSFSSNDVFFSTVKGKIQYLTVQYFGSRIYTYINGVQRASPNTVTLSSGLWHHLALTRKDDVCRVFLNGNQIHSFSDSTELYLDDTCVTNLPYLGLFSGNIDELILINGICLYESNFVPRSEPFL